MDKYVIINRENIENRIKRLRSSPPTTTNLDFANRVLLRALEELLDESIPLIPEIEKAFSEALRLSPDAFEEEDWVEIDDYISNLKLDI